MISRIFVNIRPAIVIFFVLSVPLYGEADPTIDDAPLFVSGNTKFQNSIHHPLISRIVQNIQSSLLDPEVRKSDSGNHFSRDYYVQSLQGQKSMVKFEKAYETFLRALSGEREAFAEVFGSHLSSRERAEIDEGSLLINSIPLVLSTVGLATLIQSKNHPPALIVLMGIIALWSAKSIYNWHQWKANGPSTWRKEVYFRRPSVNALGEFNWIMRFFALIQNELFQEASVEGDYLYLVLPQFSSFGVKGSNRKFVIQFLAQRFGEKLDDVRISILLIARTNLEMNKMLTIPTTVTLQRLGIPGLEDSDTLEDWSSSPENIKPLAAHAFASMNLPTKVLAYSALGIGLLPPSYLVYLMIRSLM